MKFTIIILSIILAFALRLSAQNENMILGKWKTSDGTGIIQIYKTSDGTFQGKIIKAQPKEDKKGAMIDDKNPDPALRNRPIIGLVILKDFRYDGEIWKSGTIYDPGNGKDYSCKMWLEDKYTLKIRGYIGISLFGRTEIWKRAD